MELSIALMDDAAMRELNHTFRGKNTPTNVLSFPAEEAGMLGDIVLAYETVSREARAQGKPFKDHATHLVVHGCLHLLGYDHERDDDAERMEAMETAILSGFGIGDPYTVVQRKKKK